MRTDQPLTSDDPARAEPIKIYTEFEERPKLNPQKTKETGHNVYDTHHWMRWVKKGSNGQGNEDWIEVVQKYYPLEWDASKAAYEAWVKNKEDPISGMPLTMWPLISAGQVATFQTMGIRSVEDIRDLDDGMLENCPAGTRILRDKATAWLDAAESTGKAAEAISDLRREVRDLKMRLDERNAAIAAFKEKMGTADDDTPKPRQSSGGKSKRSEERGNAG